jgi:DNA-binding GntR family transcriptional regulator
MYGHRIMGLTKKEYTVRNYTSHVRIVEALKRKDKATALAEITRHMEEAKQATMGALNIAQSSQESSPEKTE